MARTNVCRPEMVWAFRSFYVGLTALCSTAPCYPGLRPGLGYGRAIGAKRRQHVFRHPSARCPGHPDYAALEENQYRGLSTTLRSGRNDRFGGAERERSNGAHWAPPLECCGEAGESGRASLDTPPFAKSAKGRAPRVGAPRRRTNTGVSPLRCAPVEMTDLGVRKESGRMELTGHLRGNVVARWGRAVELRSIPHPELGRRKGEPIQGFLHCAALRSR